MVEKQRTLKLTKPRQSVKHENGYIIILMACYALGGSKNNVHSEDIMNKAFLWNKERFGWKKKTYSNYPDTVPLSQGLFDARKYGFLKGKYDRNYLSKDGWTLTDKGLEKAESLSSLVDVKTSKITLSQFQRKTLANFKKHDHFNLKTIDFTLYHLADVLNVSVNNLPLINSTLIKIHRWSKISDDKEALNIINEKIKKQKSLKKFLKEALSEI